MIATGFGMSTRSIREEVAVIHLLTLCAVAAVVAADPDATTPEKDAKKFAGTWKEVSREYQREAVPTKFIDKSKLIFKADGKLTMIDGFKVERTFKLDPSQTPPTIDIIETFTKPAKPGEKPVTVEFKTVGIYKLDGDKLTICYMRPDGPKAGQRPKEFRTGAKSRLFLSVYEREKP
jgi:uncharacterized protein (TIGR03067 family)